MDSGSVAKYILEEAHPVSDVQLNQVRLSKAIRRLCAVVIVHNHLGDTNQIVGNIIMVGTSTFNIGVG